jgi:DnaJ homolog subfamily C member 19
MKWIVAALVIWAAWMLLRKPAKAAVDPDEAAARRLLGVSPRAGEDAIRAAHRRVVAEAHPDRGGEGDLTARANAARDLLLARL